VEAIDLTPRYSTNEVPGRCIKCLAEEKLFDCMRELFEDEKDLSKLKQKYEILYAFLQSPELQKLCDETEKYLSEGRQLNVKIYLEDGQPKYELNLKSLA
jgi:hypothetical protein